MSGGAIGFEITLSPQDMQRGAAMGVLRHMRALGQRQSVQGMPPEHIVYSHIVGAWGEIACAHAIGREWDATVDTYKAADLGDNIQVRTGKRHDHSLIIRDEDNKDHVYFLVTCERPPLFIVHGWCMGSIVEHHPEWRVDLGGYGKPAWRVPKQRLSSRGIGMARNERMEPV